MSQSDTFPADMWQRVIRRFPWADNDITQRWVEDTWRETGGNKKVIADVLLTLEWIDGKEW